MSSEQVRAAVMAEPEKPIEVREFPPPKVEPGGVLLRTLYSEVCGTDVHLYHGRLAGARQVIVIGTPQPRLEMALSLGADEAVDLHEYPSPEARVDRIRHLTAGRGADVTIEASGAPGAVAEGMRMTRDAGTYVVVGQYTDHGPVEINPHLDINRKHLDIRGCWGTEFTHLYRATDLLTARGHDAPYEKAISRFYSLEECQQALLDVEHLQVIKAVIKPQ